MNTGLWLRSDIHCHWKSIIHVTYTVDFQYWQCILEHSFYLNIDLYNRLRAFIGDVRSTSVREGKHLVRCFPCSIGAVNGEKERGDKQSFFFPFPHQLHNWTKQVSAQLLPSLINVIVRLQWKRVVYYGLLWSGLLWFRYMLPVLKIYSTRNVNYRFSIVLAVYVGTQSI